MTSPYDGAELVPVLPTTDLDRAEAWYGRLGFRVLATYDDYRILDAGDVQLHLVRFDVADPGPSLSGVYLYVPDVDAVHAAWSAAGARILVPPREQPYGLREFEAEDPDGNRWRIGSPLEPGADAGALSDDDVTTAAGAGEHAHDGSLGTGDHAWLHIVATATCAGCELTPGAGTASGLAGRLRDEAHRWGQLLRDTDDVDVRARPAPEVWSALEYAVHVRDVLAVFSERILRTLVEVDPELGWWDHEAAIEDGFANESEVAAVVEDLAENASRLGEVLGRVDENGWSRTATRRGTEQFTVELLARFALHEVVHHRVDAELGLAGK